MRERPQKAHSAIHSACGLPHTLFENIEYCRDSRHERAP